MPQTRPQQGRGERERAPGARLHGRPRVGDVVADEAGRGCGGVAAEICRLRETGRRGTAAGRACADEAAAGGRGGRGRGGVSRHGPGGAGGSGATAAVLRRRTNLLRRRVRTGERGCYNSVRR